MQNNNTKGQEIKVMLTSEEKLLVKSEPWFEVPTYVEHMLPMDQKGPNMLGASEYVSVDEFFKAVVKEELHLEDIKRAEENTSDAENDTSHSLPSGGFIMPGFIKPETSHYENPNGFLESKEKAYLPLEIKHVDPQHIVVKGKLPEKKPLNIRFKLNPWEILKKREMNRLRIAHKRAMETEEQRRIRLEKARAAWASKKANESLEQKLIRREKNRIAMARARAAETEEQRRIRREKNRIATALRRAKLSEREKIYWRSVDRTARAASRRNEKLALMMMNEMEARTLNESNDLDPLEGPGLAGHFLNKVGNDHENVHEFESVEEENPRRLTKFETVYLKPERGVSTRFLRESPSTSCQSVPVWNPFASH